MLASNYNFKKTYKLKPYHDWTMVQNMLASQEERCLTRTKVPCQTQNEAKRVKQRNCLKLGARSQLSALEGVEGRAEALGWDQEEGQVLLSYSDLHPTNHKLVSSFFKAPLVLGRATGDFGFTRLTMVRTRGKPPRSPIQYSMRYSAAPTFE